MTPAWGRRLLRAAWALAVVGLLVSFVPGAAPRLTWLPGPAEGGFPERVGFVRDSPALPAAPGPLVMVVDDNNFGVGAWEALDASGRWWRGGDEWPALLADDGTRLVLVSEGRRSQDTTYAVRDLVSGTTTPLPQRDLRLAAVAAGVPRKWVHVNAPVAWSPDGSMLLVPLGRNASNSRAAALVDPARGEVRPLPLAGRPFGFLSDGRAAALRVSGPADAPVVALSFVGPDEPRAASVRLRPAIPWTGDALTATVSPGGKLLLVERVQGEDEVVRWFDPVTGAERRSETLRLDGVCAIGWAGDQPVFSGGDRGFGYQVRVRQLTTGGLTDLVAVHHRMQSQCVTITAAALAEGPTPMVMGTAAWTWTWYWRQLALAALLGLAVVAWVWQARKHRRGPA